MVDAAVRPDGVAGPPPRRLKGSFGAPACARCGGPTRVRTSFPDTFQCLSSRNRLCGFWFAKQKTNGRGSQHFVATVTTIRGFVHFPLGPASYQRHSLVVAILRPPGGKREDEVVYDAEIGWSKVSEWNMAFRDRWMKEHPGRMR